MKEFAIVTLIGERYKLVEAGFLTEAAAIKEAKGHASAAGLAMRVCAVKKHCPKTNRIQISCMGVDIPHVNVTAHT
jgi:hypothetical protein